MPTLHLTDIAIKALKPQSRQLTYWDDQLPAFGVRVGARAKTFTVVVGKQRRRITLGHYPAMSLQQARRKAMALISSPSVHRSRVAYDDALESYLTQHCARNNKASTARETERVLRRHFDFGSAALDSITGRRLLSIIHDLSPSAANHAFVAVRAFFSWCEGRRFIDDNPLRGAKLPYKANSRDRTLSPAELMHVWFEAVSSGKPSYQAIRLLILTGQRTQEIAGLEWSMIDEIERTITLPPILTKNNSQHTFPYGDAVASILATIPRTSPRLFPKRSEDTIYSWGTIKRHFDREVPLPHWTLHDLRRTFATLNAELGTAPHVTEALLNHKTGVRSPIQRIYDRYTYLPEMREAIHRYETHLGMLCAAVLRLAAASQS